MELKAETFLESINQAMKVLKSNEVRCERFSIPVPKWLYEYEDTQFWKNYYANHNSEFDVLFIDAHGTYQLHEDGKIYKLFNIGFETERLLYINESLKGEITNGKENH